MMYDCLRVETTEPPKQHRSPSRGRWWWLGSPLHRRRRGIVHRRGGIVIHGGGHGHGRPVAGRRRRRVHGGAHGFAVVAVVTCDAEAFQLALEKANWATEKELDVLTSSHIILASWSHICWTSRILICFLNQWICCWVFVVFQETEGALDPILAVGDVLQQLFLSSSAVRLCKSCKNACVWSPWSKRQIWQKYQKISAEPFNRNEVLGTSGGARILRDVAGDRDHVLTELWLICRHGVSTKLLDNKSSTRHQQ